MSDRKEIIKNRDPNAAENLCEQVVTEFSAVTQKDLALHFSEDQFVDQREHHTSPADGYEGLLNFENWTNDFWEKVEDEKKFNPNTFQQKNNCDSMDPL